ncbi:MAG: hypothetical protein AAGA32_17095 [Pseudomonadota bacterium]
MEDLRRLMDLDSIWTLWFWIMHIMAWSLTSHFTLGVPYDVVVQANRERDEDGPWTQHCEAMIRASVFRLVTVFDQLGPAIVGIWAFMLGSISSFAILYDHEFSVALLTLFVPLTLVYSVTVMRARAIARNGLTGQPLRNAVRSLRIWNQFCGMLGLILAAAAAIWTVISSITPLDS